MCKIDKYSRYQNSFGLHDYAMNIDNNCACGCGVQLTGRKKRWASSACADKAYLNFAIIKGNNSIIRSTLFERDKGFCNHCGVFDTRWQADHIIPVAKGGGGCTISNLQTLCLYCHNEKTKNQRVGHIANISWQEAVSVANVRLYAFGAVPKFFSKTSIEKHPLLSISLSV